MSRVVEACDEVAPLLALSPLTVRLRSQSWRSTPSGKFTQAWRLAS
jgi:hypothetical protein